MNKLTQYQFIGIIIAILLIGILAGHFILPKTIIKTELSSFFDKNEWARLVIKNDITYTTDLWETRYGVDVRIFDEDKTIGVVITTANGEEPIDNPDYFRKLFKPRIESSIEEFDWLKDYQIVLTIL